jgi:3-hydroxybutyryl-CoA dehydratase
MTHFESLVVGHEIVGKPFAPTRETIREFCDASLDYNPLHLDDNYMKGSFGKSSFGGIIMHGMTNFGLLTRMLTIGRTRMMPFTGGLRPAGACL